MQMVFEKVSKCICNTLVMRRIFLFSGELESRTKSQELRQEEELVTRD